MNDAMVIKISEGLNMNKSLSYLNLSKNEITAACIHDLTDALIKMPNMIDLDLSHNPIGDLGI